MKFKIEKGIKPPRRGPKAKIEYDELFDIIPEMDLGDSIKITTVPEANRNSTYITLTEVFGRRLKPVDTGSKNPNVFTQDRRKYQVKSMKVGEDKVEMRVFRLA